MRLTAPSRRTRSSLGRGRNEGDNASPPGAPGRRAADRRAAVRLVAPRHDGLGARTRRQLDHARDRGLPAAAGAGVRPDLLSPRRLGAALGHRVSRRSPQCLHPRSRLRRRRRDDALRPQKRGGGSRSGQTGLVLQHVPAVSHGAARHHRDRRCLQHFRVSRDFVAVDLRADRARQGPAGAGRRLPVSDHGHDRRDLLRDRHRAPLSRYGQPQHPRHCRAPRADGGGELAARACRAGLPHRRHLAEAGTVSAACVASERLRLRTVLRHGVPGGDGHEGCRLRAAAPVLFGVWRCHQLQESARLGSDARAVRRGHVHRLAARDLRAERQADAGLLLVGPNRLHHARHQPGE